MIWPNDPREAFLQYVLTYIGKWYKWGGDDPSGFDCSGLVVEGLQSVGVMERDEDMSAVAMAHEFQRYILENRTPVPGALAFYYRSGVVGHVAVCLSRWQILEAAGGGSHVKTEADAVKFNAFIKVRPFSYQGLHSICDPIRKLERSP